MGTDMGTPDRQRDTRRTRGHSENLDTLNIWTFNLSNLDTGTLRLFLQWGTVIQTRNVLPKISMKFFTDRKHFLKTSSCSRGLGRVQSLLLRLQTDYALCVQEILQ